MMKTLRRCPGSDSGQKNTENTNGQNQTMKALTLCWTCQTIVSVSKPVTLRTSPWHHFFYPVQAILDPGTPLPSDEDWISGPMLQKNRRTSVLALDLQKLWQCLRCSSCMIHSRTHTHALFHMRRDTACMNSPFLSLASQCRRSKLQRNPRLKHRHNLCSSTLKGMHRLCIGYA